MKSYDIIFIHPSRILNPKKAAPRSLFMLFPVGLLAMADLCEKEGFSSRIINLPLEQVLDPNFSLTNCLKNIDFKICGIDIHWALHSYGAMEIVKIMKQINPNVKVILGGYTATYFHDEILKYYKFVDGIIRGEGEIPFLRYCQNINRNRSLDSVPNLSYRDSSGHIKINPQTFVAASLDDLNFTNLSLVQNGEKYVADSQKIMRVPFNLAIGRGCPYNCPYCGGGRSAQALLTKRKKTLLRNPEKVLEDLRNLIDNYKADAVFFGHGTYPGCLKYWETLFKMIQKEKMDLGGDLEIWRFPFPRKMWQLFYKTFRLKKSSISICPRTFSVRAQQKIRELCDPSFNFPINKVQDLIKNAIKFNTVLRIWMTIGFPFQNLKDLLMDYYFTLKLMIKYAGSDAYPINVMNDLVSISPASPAFESPEVFDLKLTFKSFRQTVEMYKRIKFALGGWNTVTNYRLKHFSSVAIRIWNNIFNVTEIPLFISSPH